MKKLTDFLILSVLPIVLFGCVPHSCGLSCEVLSQKFSSRVKKLSENSVYVSKVSPIEFDDFKRRMGISTWNGEWFSIDTSEGFILKADGCLLFEGRPGCSVEYGIFDTGIDRRPLVVLYDRQGQCLIAALATDLGG